MLYAELLVELLNFIFIVNVALVYSNIYRWLVNCVLAGMALLHRLGVLYIY